jgi:hypothetical protein
MTAESRKVRILPVIAQTLADDERENSRGLRMRRIVCTNSTYRDINVTQKNSAR